MITLLAFMILARQGNPYVDSGLPPDEYATMSGILANYPIDPGTAYYVDENSIVHSNRVGAASSLVLCQPVGGQPGVYTDGSDTFAGPPTQNPPTSIDTSPDSPAPAPVDSTNTNTNTNSGSTGGGPEDRLDEPEDGDALALPEPKPVESKLSSFRQTSLPRAAPARFAVPCSSLACRRPTATANSRSAGISALS